MDTEKTKRYLEMCDRLFHSHTEVDPEVRYEYLVEMARAFAGVDEQLRAKYDLMAEEAHKAVLTYYGTEKDVKWQLDYDKSFELCNDFLLGLFRFIESMGADGIEEVVKAQLDFARMQLHAQKRLLDTLLFYIPMRILIRDDKLGGDKYGRAAVQNRDMCDQLSTLQRKVWFET